LIRLRVASVVPLDSILAGTPDAAPPDVFAQFDFQFVGHCRLVDTASNLGCKSRL
jgi:hypothetical protein